MTGSRPGGENAVEIEIQSGDVGNQVEAYPLYPDIGTTIGGYTVQSEDVGVLTSVTPVTADIGETVGKALSSNTSTRIGSLSNLWVNRLCDFFEMELLQVNAYSGSAYTRARQTGNSNYKFTEGFSESTVNKCRKRDNEGNWIEPDVIIVFSRYERLLLLRQQRTIPDHHDRRSQTPFFCPYERFC